MKLRLRLALTAVAATLPMIGALLWFDAASQHRAAEQRLTAFVAARMPALRERCEAAPSTWGGLVPPNPFAQTPRGGPGPPPGDRPAPPPPPPPEGERRPRARPAEAFAYGEDLRAQNPAAPALPDALKRAIEGHDVAVAPFVWPSEDVEVLLRMSWGTGPCAYVLARGSTDPAWGSILPETQLWMLPMLFVLAAVLIAMGPVVRRIQRLTEAVRRSASAAYASAVAIDGRDEIAELSRAFDAAGREIRARLEEKEQRERALRDFLSNTTHDVMIPLTVLQGHLATLRERAAEGLAPDVAVVVSTMDEAHYMA
jgi:HAMP domain-containing protein